MIFRAISWGRYQLVCCHKTCSVWTSAAIRSSNLHWLRFSSMPDGSSIWTSGPVDSRSLMSRCSKVYRRENTFFWKIALGFTFSARFCMHNNFVPSGGTFVLMSYLYTHEKGVPKMSLFWLQLILACHIWSWMRTISLDFLLYSCPIWPTSSTWISVEIVSKRYQRNHLSYWTDW